MPPQQGMAPPTSLSAHSLLSLISTSPPAFFFLLHPCCLFSSLSISTHSGTSALSEARAGCWDRPRQGVTNPPVEGHSLLFLCDPFDWAGHTPRSLGDQLGATLDPRGGVPSLMDLFGLPDRLHHHARHGLWRARLPGAPSSEALHLH